MDIADTCTDLHWPREPYPGLRPFRVTPTSDETLIFYGRNGHKDEILKRLDQQKLVFVTGPSGCGKSSLVRVGVLPVLQAGLLTKAGSEWRIVAMRPGLAPVSNLATALSDLCPESSQRIHSVLSRDVSGLWMAADVINEETQGAPILVVIDQFEEIFGVQVPSDQVDQFVRIIVRFFERPHPNVYVVTTMRTDFLDACTKFAGLAAAINASQFLTPILGLQELIEAISRPAEDYGGALEKPLLDRLLLDMRPGAGYDPDNLALLQHALQWLWRRACIRNGLTPWPNPASSSEPRLTLDLKSYTDAGGLRGILNVHADEVASRYQANDRTALETLFKRLAERAPGGGYRRSPATVSEISRICGSPDNVWRITNDLSHEDVGFLEVRDAPQHSEALVDICHEALIRTWDKYKCWVDDEAEKVRLVRRVANDAVDWQQRGRRDEDLQHGHVLHFIAKRWNELAPTRAWADRYALSPNRPERLSNLIALIEGYFEESNRLANKEEARFEQLRVREATTRIRLARDRLFGVVMLLAIMAVFLSYFNVAGKRQAKELVAGSFRVLAEDSLADGRDAPAALLWTLEGLRRAPGLESVFEPLVYRALQDLRLRKIYRGPPGAVSVSFSPDAKFFVSANQDAKIRISSVESGVIDEIPIPKAPMAGGGFYRARWSPNGEFIAISGREAITLLSTCSLASLQNAISACKNHDRADCRQPMTIAFDGRLTNALFSPDSKILLAQTGPTFFQASTALFDIALLQAMPDSVQQPMKAIDDTTWAAAFSSDGDELAVGGRDGNIRIFHRPDFSESRPLKKSEATPVNQIWSLAFSGGSKNELYSGHGDGSILSWNINSGASTLFRKQSGQVFQLLASRDGEWVAASSDNGFVMLWSSREPYRPPIRIGPHGGPVWNFDLGGNDANWILAPSGDSIYLWTRRGALSPSEQLSVAPETHSPSLRVTTALDTYSVTSNDKAYYFRRPKEANSASWAARTPEGDYFAIAEDDGSALLYSAREGDPIVRYRGAPRRWKAIWFEGDRIVGASEAGDQISWPFFSSKATMLEYANRSIPIVDNHPMQLSNELLCLLVKIDSSLTSGCQGDAVAPGTSPVQSNEREIGAIGAPATASRLP